MTSYVDDLASVIDMDAIRGSGLRLGVDPLGGASVAYWPAIRDRYGLDLTITNEVVDPQFGFMTRDWDGRIRMDPSSPYAMARLVELRDRFDVAFANDTDADRHGIVTPGAGLLNPNHFLSVSVAHLFGGGRGWGPDVAVGKTLVSSAMLDRVAADLGRRLLEVPVGFKWFVTGLVDGSLGFGGEESAGASFLRRDGSVWTTDKDGIIACLLAAEMTARTGRDPGVAYEALTERFGAPVYRRIDAPATPAQKAVLAQLSPEQVPATELAGEPVTAVLTTAPGNGAAIGGVKVMTEQRLVRCPAVRHGECLQDLCGELPRRGATSNGSSRRHRPWSGGHWDDRGTRARARPRTGTTTRSTSTTTPGTSTSTSTSTSSTTSAPSRTSGRARTPGSSRRRRARSHTRSATTSRASPTSRSIRSSGSRSWVSSHTPATSRPASRSRHPTASSGRPIERAPSPSSTRVRPRRLTAYTLDGGGSESLFVPFLDATSGRETYGAGRYLDLEPEDDGTYALDFNLAYHPYCVYAESYSCPLTPAENRLPIRIEAGERLAEEASASTE